MAPLAAVANPMRQAHLLREIQPEVRIGFTQ
jgi:hypothetical protein